MAKFKSLDELLDFFSKKTPKNLPAPVVKDGDQIVVGGRSFRYDQKVFERGPITGDGSAVGLSHEEFIRLLRQAEGSDTED